MTSSASGLRYNPQCPTSDVTRSTDELLRFCLSIVQEILCKALATTREIELAGRILLTAKSEAGAVKQLCVALSFTLACWPSGLC
jgi:hypothetical protein